MRANRKQGRGRTSVRPNGRATEERRRRGEKNRIPSTWTFLFCCYFVGVGQSFIRHQEFTYGQVLVTVTYGNQCVHQ